ncbi:hypothetical protein BBK36DRAFT_1131046, partial [Trichoderma citrinoviride]
FYSIKKDANTLCKVKSKGSNITKCLNLGSSCSSSSIISTLFKLTAFCLTGSRTSFSTSYKQACKIDIITRSKSNNKDNNNNILSGYN